MNITIPQKDLVEELDLRDPETLDLLAKKLADTWNYSQEHYTKFPDRICDLLKEGITKEIAVTRKRILDYGGDLRGNFEYCEKQTAQGKTVDASKLRYNSN